MDWCSSVFKQSFRQPDALLSYQEYSAFAALQRLPTHPGLSVEIAASRSFVCSSQWQLDRVHWWKNVKKYILPIDIVGRWCYNTVVVETARIGETADPSHDNSLKGETTMSAAYDAKNRMMMWCRMLNSRVTAVMAGASDCMSVCWNADVMFACHVAREHCPRALFVYWKLKTEDWKFKNEK